MSFDRILALVSNYLSDSTDRELARRAFLLMWAAAVAGDSSIAGVSVTRDTVRRQGLRACGAGRSPRFTPQAVPTVRLADEKEGGDDRFGASAERCWLIGAWAAQWTCLGRYPGRTSGARDVLRGCASRRSPGQARDVPCHCIVNSRRRRRKYGLRAVGGCLRRCSRLTATPGFVGCLVMRRPCWHGKR